MPRGAVLLASLALLAGCGGAPKAGDTGSAATDSMPPAATVVDLSVTPINAWDSLMVDAARALAGGNAAETRRVRDRLMHFPEEAGTGNPTSGHDAFPGPSRAVRLYVLGELAAAINDARGLQSAMDSLMAPLLTGSALPRKPSSYALTLQALVLEREGQHDRAMVRLDSLIARIPAEQYPVLWVGGTIERPRRLAWLRAQGLTARADSLANTVTGYAADKLIQP